MSKASPHWLEPLFNPQSIAVIGASARQGRPGYEAVVAAHSLGSTLAVHPVTPKYQEIAGHPTSPSIAAVPGPVDLAIIASSSERMEKELAEAIKAGVRSALIFAEAHDPVKVDPSKLQRIADLCKEAKIPLLGPNSIGYVNFATKAVGSWYAPSPQPAGGIAVILQSGSTYCSSTSADPRLGFSFSGQPGQEAVLTFADLADYALSLPTTKVLGLYIETIRRPDAFIQLLEKARAKDIPVVVIKPGRSQAGRAAVATHAGRMASDDTTMDAICRRYGVSRVESMDEWWATLLLLSLLPPLGPGGLAALTDSGGQRALLIDAASMVGLPFARFNEATTKAFRAQLAPSLEPANPVDLWGGEEDVAGHIAACLQIADRDPDTAVTMLMTEWGIDDSDPFTDRMVEGTIRAKNAATKPAIASTFSARQFNPRRGWELVRAGLPVLDGTQSAVRALKHAFNLRDFRARASKASAPALSLDKARLLSLLDEAESDESGALALLAAAGIATTPSARLQDQDAVLRTARRFGYPLALKTAEGHAHKSDVGGVRLGLADEAALTLAYRDMAERLGPKVTLQPMAPKGSEFALGALVDPDFGPLVMLAAGGVLVELLGDKTFVLAPLDRQEAEIMIGGLKSAKLLEGYRGQSAGNRQALAELTCRLSTLIHVLRDAVAEIDINPVIVTDKGAIAVDALIRRKK